MAMNFTTIKNTNLETVIHFEAPSNETATITLADLAATSQARNSDTPKVNIVKFTCTGDLGSGVKVSRGIKTIIAAAPENAPVLDLNANGWVDNINNDQDIVIAGLTANKAISGYIVLRKVQGWSTKVETEQYGAYDDVTRVGASTTQSGSPDKV